MGSVSVWMVCHRMALGYQDTSTEARRSRRHRSFDRPLQPRVLVASKEFATPLRGVAHAPRSAPGAAVAAATSAALSSSREGWVSGAGHTGVLGLRTESGAGGAGRFCRRYDVGIALVPAKVSLDRPGTAEASVGQSPGRCRDSVRVEQRSALHPYFDRAEAAKRHRAGLVRRSGRRGTRRWTRGRMRDTAEFCHEPPGVMIRGSGGRPVERANSAERTKVH
jgi:hypothetical protein